MEIKATITSRSGKLIVHRVHATPQRRLETVTHLQGPVKYNGSPKGSIAIYDPNIKSQPEES